MQCWNLAARYRTPIQPGAWWAIPPKELWWSPRPGQDFRLGFIFPNFWQNYLGSDNRIVVAFAPVDYENTVLYLRFYQRFVRVPLLRELVNRLAMPFNMRILHQDRDVVITEPGASALKPRPDRQPLLLPASPPA